MAGSNLVKISSPREEQPLPDGREGALAASGSVGALLNLLIGFSLGLATGVNVLHALRFGEVDHPGMRRRVTGAGA